MIRNRIAVIFAAAVLTISPAYAFDHENFSIYSSVFGASDIDDSKADLIKDCARYIQDGCKIIFRYTGDTVITIMVEGEGDKFLAYCYGAIFQFDPDTKHATENGGRLLAEYLMSNDPDRPTSNGFTVAGVPFMLEKTESGYSFIISSVSSGGD